MTDFDKVIAEAETQNGLTPGVLTRLIKVESAGNIDAKSPAGAIGLTQLLPDTAKELGVDPNDPVQNIHGGARYLRQNLDKFKGDYGQAIAGYNAGPNHPAVVKKDWENLPDETKAYTNKFLDFIQPKEVGASTEGIVPNLKVKLDFTRPDGLPVIRDKMTFIPPQASKPEPSWIDKQLDWNHGKSTDEILQGIRDGNTPENAHKQIETALIAMLPGSLFKTPLRSFLTGAALSANGDTPEEKLKNAAIGGTATAVGGKVIQGGIDKLAELRNSTLMDVTQQEINKVLTNLTRKVGGLKGTGSYPNQRIMNDMSNTASSNVSAAYNKLEHVSNTSSGIDIHAPQASAAINNVNNLDNTALGQIRKNALASSGLDNVQNGVPLTPAEAANLHKHLGRITGIDGETQHAIKQAQFALADDITNSGVPELTDALNAARTRNAQKDSFSELDNLIKKHIKPTDTGDVINYNTLNTALKNWSLSNDGKSASKFTPGLEEGIKNLRRVMNAHTELKTLINPPPEQGTLSKLFGNDIQSILSKNIGALAGGAIGGAPGALAGEGLQLGLRGASLLGTEGIKAALRTKPLTDMYRNALRDRLNGIPGDPDIHRINALKAALMLINKE